MTKNLLHSRLFLVLSACVLVTVAYIGWSVWQWNQYNSNSQRNISAMNEAAVAGTQTTDQKPSANLASLNDVSNTLSGADGLCDENWTVAWQRFIPTVDNLVTNCRSATKRLATVKEDTDSIIAFLETERELLGVLEPLAKNAKLTNKKWDTTIKDWKAAQTSVAAIEPSQEYKPVLQQLEKQLQKVNNAWAQLVKADKNEKRDSYESAYDALDQAITGMIDVADESEARLQTLLLQLQRSVEKL